MPCLKKGAKDLLNSIIWTIVLNISVMAPVVLSFKFLDEHMSGLLNASNSHKDSVFYYVIMSIALFIVIFVIANFQYKSAYTKIYEESAKRRIRLAETLRKLPLAFFWQKGYSGFKLNHHGGCYTDRDALFSFSSTNICIYFNGSNYGSDDVFFITGGCLLQYFG